MVLKLHNLKPSAGSKHRPKRVGRGDASGHGSYSGRGQKGQKSRTGGTRRLQQKGLRRLLLATPKTGGFKSPYAKLAIVNLKVLEAKFQDGDKISPLTLKEKGIIGKIDKGVKILGDGRLTKKLAIEGCAVSQSAREKIEKAGGSIK